MKQKKDVKKVTEEKKVLYSRISRWKNEKKFKQKMKKVLPVCCSEKKRFFSDLLLLPD